MQEALIRKLHEYVRDNHPDLLLTLEEEKRVTKWLHENVFSIDNLISELLQANQPVLMIEERCLEELIRQFRPSRFNYIKTLLENEFPAEADRLQHRGILTIELINLGAACRAVFDELGFSEEKENDRHLHYAVTGAVQEYFK